MKKLLLSSVLLVGLVNPISAYDTAKIVQKYPWVRQSGWISYTDSCEFKNDIEVQDVKDCSTVPVTENSFLPQWAGNVTYVYFNKNTSQFPYMKVSLNWIIEDSKYTCGQILELKTSEAKDFTHRSLALKKCY